MAKFSGQYRVNSEQGQAALKQIQSLKVGDVYEERLLGAFPEKARWVCVGRTTVGAEEVVELAGHWCDIPLMVVEIRTNEHDISLSIKKEPK